MENFPVNFPNIHAAKTEHLDFTGVLKTEHGGLDFSYALWYNRVIDAVFL